MWSTGSEPGLEVTAIHPIHRRLLAEDLIRLRRSDEQRRYAAAQRRGRIDPNPHQIDAVVFALRRIPEGGCILADEVGLGKTIEAGLVIAQLLAEGMRRVLLVVPKSLQGQWHTELYSLFGIEAREGKLDPDSFEGSGVFLVHRELASGVKGASILKTVDPFDLIVVDEAHEIFAGVYKRFDKEGIYSEDSREAVTAGRVRELVKRGGTPVLLLTATPIQNSLAELWGLVQYVEPTGTLLGRLSTFRELFCDGSDRIVLPEQALELRRRLATVMQRTLRRQAQEFLEVPFVERQTRLIEYSMSPEEKSLYNDVTAWLMKPDLCAFRGSQRLLLIGFHRRMASSLPALAASLDKVAHRLRAQLTRTQKVESKLEPADFSLAEDFAHDLEEDVSEFELAVLPELRRAESQAVSEPEASPAVERIRAELEQVETFAARARSLPHDSKARCLLDTLRVIRERAARDQGTGRAIVFTESLTTQAYIRDLLLEDGRQPEDITLFRGDNETPEALRALDRWENEVASSLPAGNRPSREVALRLALVHEFRERSKVFISTEAGAKGLNLQFCDTLINYDLPWNPQRIEQRIGRIHRYGQRRGVTVMSFLARENETQRLMFDILSQKLDLFGKVLDSSDTILHVPSNHSPQPLISGIGAGYESQLRRIFDQARSVDDVIHELQGLRMDIETKREEFDAEQSRAAELVEERLDDTLRAVFRKYEHELPAELAGLDADIERVVAGFLTAIGAAFDRSEMPGRVALRIHPAPRLPKDYRNGGEVMIGDTRDLRDGDVLHTAHPLVRAAIDEARVASSRPFHVRLGAADRRLPEPLAGLRGRRGHLVVTKIAYRGIESVDQIITTGMLEGAVEPLDSQTVEALLSLAASDRDAPEAFALPATLEDAVGDAVIENQNATARSDRDRFERMLRQLDRYVEDQAMLLRRKQAVFEERIDEAERRSERALTAGGRAQEEEIIASCRRQIEQLNARIATLQNGDDPDYQLWRGRLHERRFRKARVERILEIAFEIAGAASEPC
jgi:adenine-specific DNA-methyltransferase